MAYAYVKKFQICFSTVYDVKDVFKYLVCALLARIDFVLAF